MQLSPSKTEWVKFGKIKRMSFVGRDMICVGSGCYMIFINLNNGEETLYHAESKRLGEGVCTFAGHKTLPVIAFAEKCRSPRVIIMNCPAFQRISVLNKFSDEDYMTLAFSEGDFLITLNHTPSFEIIVWNWRNEEKIATMNSDIYANFQLIRCNLSTPIHFAQVQTGHTKLNLWDVAVCGKKCVLTPHKITPPEDSGVFSDILWTTEGTLFVLDLLGHAYALGSDNELTRVIEWEGEGTTITSFSWFKAGLAIAGPTGEVKHFKKVGSWVCDWTIVPPIPLKKIFSNYKDVLIGVSQDGEIMHYDSTESNFKFITKSQSKFNDISLIYPMGEYFVTLQHNREITSWEVATGELKNLKKLNGNALALTANPEYPYVGIAYDHGVLELLSLYTPDKITSMASFNLSKTPLNNVYFTDIGKLIVAANLELGEFFIIEGIPGSKMQVIATVEAHHQICDYMLVASRTCMRLFTIHVTSDTYIAGNKIVRYCVIRGQPGAETKEYALETDHQMYSKIYATTKMNRDRVFYAIPMTTKCIHEISTKRADPVARVTDIIKTEHLMKKILLYVDKNHVITYAYDGLVIIRNVNFGPKIGVIMPQYRAYGGVLKAYVDPLTKYVISLGRDNTLVCTSLTKVKMNFEKQTELRELMNSERFALMFSRPTTGFSPIGDLAGVTWFEMEKIQLEINERKRSEKERESILAEFKEIQAEVQQLLTKNLEGPDNEKIDIQEFNLDVALKGEKIKKAQEECKYMKVYMEALIIAQDKVTAWLKNFCWDQMQVQGETLFAIFDNFDITNYVMLPTEDQMMNRWTCVNVYRKLEKQLANDDTFEPWEPKTSSEMNLQLRNQPIITEDEQTANLLDFLENEEQLEEEQIDVDTDTAFKGSVSHLFVDVAPVRYTQQQVSSFFQTEFETLFSLVEVYKLKQFYNKQFQEMKTLKIREMGLVLERNARLRHIISELNYFSTDKINIIIEDPVWSPLEDPEIILTVDKREVGFEPYISPSEQSRLNAIAAEEERIRLLLLADDFRERALMAMMNGVLEIRWEDELKKDVPKPKCMFEKEPEKYTEEDLRAIYAYEEDVKFLNSERERYKKMLESEYVKLGNTLRDSINRFNKRLSNSLQYKIQVDSGIRQENLKVTRMRLKNLKRILRNNKEDEILSAIAYNHKEIEAVTTLIISLQKSLNELRNNMETLQAKEKLVEKAFKKDFAEASPVVQEQSTKLYKRRPKANIRSIQSVTLNLEIAKCMVSQEKTLILTAECLEYLKSLDTLDLYVNIPPAVDESTFLMICKHRRVKIENEIRIRAATLEIAEAEATIQTFQKLLAHKKDYGQKLLLDLEQLRSEKLNSFHDMELQLILREGIVEVPRTGRIADFEDAVLVSRKDVETINKIILRAGNKKIKSMKETMNFRRGILAMEWEHRRLQMQIHDLHSYIEDIESVKVTKEIQAYLKSKARGFAPEKLSFEQEIQAMKEQYIKQINESKYLVQKVQAKINVLKQHGKKLQGENDKLNEEITRLNVDICEFQLERDFPMEQRERDIIKTRQESASAPPKAWRKRYFLREVNTLHNHIKWINSNKSWVLYKILPTPQNSK